jgi:hypothetical protein
VDNNIATQHISIVCAIEVPRKISRPKIKTIFQPEPSYSDIDEGHFICPDIGKTVLKLAKWSPGERKEKISFIENKDTDLFNKIQFDKKWTSQLGKPSESWSVSSGTYSHLRV